MSRIAVIGGGAWGTALAIVLARNHSQHKHEIRMWAFEKEVVESIRDTRVNSLFLPSNKVPEKVQITNDLAEALTGADIVVSVMPSHHCRRVFTAMAPHLRESMLFVSATKGIENDSLLRMSEIIFEVVRSKNGFSPRVGALSGPTFAKEVAQGDPTAIVIASSDDDLCHTVMSEFSDPGFRVYMNEDIAGVEYGGALKNVIAIAAGVCDGLGLGHNSVAALITRGLSEITRLAVACGARQQTLSGLAGMGDLVLTCTGGLSRNRSVGVELGRGSNLSEIIAGMHGMVAEGVLTTHAAMGLARKMQVEMPITELMYAILHDGKSPQAAIRELMARPGKVE